MSVDCDTPYDNMILFKTFCFGGKAIVHITCEKDTAYVISCIVSNTKEGGGTREKTPKIERILIPELKLKGLTLETIENDFAIADISDVNIVISGLIPLFSTIISLTLNRKSLN